MTESEVIERVHAAHRELQPLLDFIHAGRIEPKDGCVSYTFGAAQLRATDASSALVKLMSTGMQCAKERATFSAIQQAQRQV